MISYQDLIFQLERVANIGSYEINLVKETWVCSDNFLKIFGIPFKEKFNVEEFKHYIHPEDVERVMEYYYECLKYENEFESEYRSIKDNGEIIYVHNQSKIVRNNRNKAVKVSGFVRDISLLKKYESKFHDFEKLNKQKNDVLQIIAHDLKGPLSNIHLIAGMISDASREDFNDYIRLISNSCKMANCIIDDLSEITQIENGEYKLTKSCTNINQLLTQSIERHNLNARQKNVEIKTSFCNDSYAMVHPFKFSRVIDNLLSNAIKFSDANQSVELSTEKKNDKLVLKIKDNGVGIKKENLEYTFQKFSKLRRPGTKGEKSTGLGLSITKGIIDLHGGKIVVESEENKGTVFSIEIYIN